MAARSARSRSRSLRSQVRNAIALVAAVSLLLFAVPLAVVAGRLIDSQALARLQRDATRAVASVPDNTLEAGTPVPIPRAASGTALGVYDAKGRRVAGTGPATSALAAAAVDGREHDGHDEGDLSVVVPVLSDTAVAGSVRAGEPLTRLRAEVLQAWALLATLALLVIVVALLLARRAAGRVSRPFEDITAAAHALGEGRVSALPTWGIAEADAAGQALQASAVRIDDLLAQERQFVADASHQLRTPLAGMLLSLEEQPPDVPAALGGIEHLRSTIADLLSLRSRGTAESCDPGAVATEAVALWSSKTRGVTLRCDDVGRAGLSAAALRQCLDVLIDNALRHGRGPVTVTLEPYGEHVLVEVADQGKGFSPDATPGTGLQLASRLVEQSGGSLLIRRRAPQPRVALLLPPAAQSTSNR